MSPAERSPHIGFAVYDAASRGSVISITRRQAEYLAGRGFRVTLMTNSPNVEWSGVTTQFVPACDSAARRVAHRIAEAYSRRLPGALSRFSLKNTIDQICFPGAIARALEKSRVTAPVNLIIACQHAMAIGLRRLRQRQAIPFVIMSHGDIFEHPAGSFNPALTCLYRRGATVAARTADGVITVSQRLRERTIQLGASPANVDVLYNGIELSEVGQAQERRASDARCFRILAVGRLSAEKGFDLLLRALASLRVDDIQLQIAGQGVQLAALRTLADELKLTERVQFLGELPRHQMGIVYGAADLIALPSRSDAMPLVALEAMSCGIPIVAARVGGLPELVEDGISGILIPPEDPAALAAAIVQVKSDPALGRQLSAGGLERVKRFSWPALLERFESLVCRHLRCPASVDRNADSSIDTFDEDHELISEHHSL